jgi:hypothetical protein
MLHALFPWEQLIADDFLVDMTKTIQDKVLEQFSEAIPRIGSSNVVRNLERVFAKLDKMLAGAFRGFVVPCFVI